MRELHVVGTDADGALLLATSPQGAPSFRVREPDRRPRRARDERSVRRPATPAQIQARLRTGTSPEALARETGTDVEKVLRWAAPVQAEMAGVLQGALGTHVTEGDRRSRFPLQDLVARATQDTGLEVTWQTSRRSDGRWRVLLRLVDERGARTASWIWDGRGRRLEAASSRARRLSFGD